MVKNNFTNSPMNDSNWNGFTDGLVSFIKFIVKDSMEEVIRNKMYENLVFDQNLTTKQLCERWNISDTTLLTWERKGIISPIQTGGRKKLYSLKDIREVETDGYIKNVA